MLRDIARLSPASGPRASNSWRRRPRSCASVDAHRTPHAATNTAIVYQEHMEYAANPLMAPSPLAPPRGDSPRAIHSRSLHIARPYSIVFEYGRMRRSALLLGVVSPLGPSAFPRAMRVPESRVCNREASRSRAECLQFIPIIAQWAQWPN